MSTNQIFIESTYNDYQDDLFIIEQVSSIDNLLNQCPTVTVTSDSVVNVVWFGIGNFDFMNNGVEVCVQNPLLVSRNDSGVFNSSNAVSIIDSDGKPITDFEFPVSCTTTDNNGIMIFGFKDGILQLYIGYIDVFPGTNLTTYKISQQIFVTDTIDGQRVSVLKGNDNRVIVLFTNSDNNLDGLSTSDYGNTFDKISIEDYSIDSLMTAILSKQDNSELSFFITDGGQLGFVIDSVNSSSTEGTVNTPGQYEAAISGTILEMDLSYPGVFFDQNSYNSTYAAILQDKSESPNNSNIIVLRTDDSGLSYFKIRE